MRKITTAELVAGKPTPEEFWRLPRHPIVVVLNNVRSLENVGLIFRLADATRVERLYLCGITGYPPRPNDDRPPNILERAERMINKTAIQTVQWVPWEHREETLPLIQELKARHYQIVVVEQATQSIAFTQASYQLPVCLVFGHERTGVEDEILELADEVVHIPMYGMGNSLNVAMAYAIMGYHLINCCLTEAHPIEWYTRHTGNGGSEARKGSETLG